MELKAQLIKICCEGCDDKSCNKNCPDYKYIELVLAEFDRLTVKNVNLQTCLDTICGPIRTEGDIGYIKRTVIPLLYEQCKTISAQTLERVLAYLDSQKASEKPCCHQPNLGKDCHICSPKCEHKNGGISYYSEGVLKQWCGDCKEWVKKPLTQCPECIWGQKKVHYLTEEAEAMQGTPGFRLRPYHKFWVYERCPRCHGSGVI